MERFPSNEPSSEDLEKKIEINKDAQTFLLNRLREPDITDIKEDAIRQVLEKHRDEIARAREELKKQREETKGKLIEMYDNESEDISELGKTG